MNQYPQQRLVVLAKEPIPGFVKTRIAASLGDEYAAYVARTLLDRTFGLCEAFLKSTPKASVHWYVAPDVEGRYWKQFSCDRFFLHQQAGGDLGNRLMQGIEPWLSAGDHVVCIGMDCPFLTVSDVQHSFQSLQEGQVVLQPAKDGGYVLIGLRQWVDGFFENMTWSTETVALQTIARFQNNRWSYVLRKPLQDIDFEKDLASFMFQL